MEDGFADDAVAALAEACTVNKAMRRITFSLKCVHASLHYKVESGATTYEAFGAMLRGNTSLNLEVPSFGDAFDDEKIVVSHNWCGLSRD